MELHTMIAEGKFSVSTPQNGWWRMVLFVRLSAGGGETVVGPYPTIDECRNKLKNNPVHHVDGGYYQQLVDGRWVITQPDINRCM